MAYSRSACSFTKPIISKLRFWNFLQNKTTTRSMAIPEKSFNTA